jgi:hypothetical protein
MYTLLYGKFFFLKKLRLIYLKCFFIVFKIFLLFIFWSFFLFLVLIIFILFYKFIKKYKNNLLLWFNLNWYFISDIIQKFKESDINQKEKNPVYVIYNSDEDIEESKSKSTEIFIDNPNNEDIEFIDDFSEIFITIDNINYNTLFSNNLDAKNNLIKGYIFDYNDEQPENFDLDK